MLPPSVQSIIHAEGVRCRAVAVRSGRRPVRARESKVRFADQPPRTRSAAPAPTFRCSIRTTALRSESEKQFALERAARRRAAIFCCGEGIGLRGENTVCFWPSVKRCLSGEYDQANQRCGEVIVKIKQPGESLERSSSSLVVVVQAGQLGTSEWAARPANRRQMASYLVAHYSVRP